MITSKQIQLVQHSFALVKPIAPAAADLFYQRLFRLDPSLKAMFKGDMVQQGRMLMSVLGTAVGGLSNLEKLAPVVRGLGARHVAYGVQPAHYTTVGAALMWTLEQGLGDAFDDETRRAWSAAYDLLAEVMQLGAMEATPA